MKIEFLGHAAFMLTDDSGYRYLIDPYESGGFSGRVGYDPIDIEPDVIIITHDHLDHCHTATIPGTFDVIRLNGRFEDVTFRSVSVFHDMYEGTKFGGTVDMKIFTMNGITICHCGDIGELLDDDAKLSAIGNVDILIVPTGGFYTLGPDGAATVTKKINPKIVIPCHYKTPKCGFDIEPVDPFLDYFESVQVMNDSSIEVDVSNLPSSCTCVVLNMLYG